MKKPVKAAKKSTEPVLEFASAAKFQAWLTKEHARSSGVWLRLGKGAAKALTYAQALDVALAWGWIDSHKKSLDETAWLQRFGPRTAKSPWSKINCAKAEALVVAGKMKPAGLTEIERAKKDGRWARAYDGARVSVVPPDLAAALAENERALTFFETLDGANRYAILYRVQTAKKTETRAERIAKFVGMCARGEKIHAPRVK
jgi:uncharacterized protein YdeI (YjbR/CyaY-like superfamily)